MPSTRPLPTVIGPTENALRALLTKTLSTTKIKSYPAWVVLNAASGADSPTGSWRRAVGDSLKVGPDVITAVIDELCTDGLLDVDGSLTPVGAAELANARTAVATTTSVLVAGVDEEDQTTTRIVLDHVRQRAEQLLDA